MPSSLLDLPFELQTLIIKDLPYPDLLALKHSSRHFFLTIRTTKYDRVNWLLARPELNLPLPKKTKCTWRTDQEFCANPEVKSILYRRRKHLECAEYGYGRCLVVSGARCEGSKIAKDAQRIQRLSVRVLQSRPWQWAMAVFATLDAYCQRMLRSGLFLQVLFGIALAATAAVYISHDARDIAIANVLTSP